MPSCSATRENIYGEVGNNHRMCCFLGWFRAIRYMGTSTSMRGVSEGQLIAKAYDLEKKTDESE